MKTRALDSMTGLLLFLSGIGIACLWYAASHAFAFFGPPSLLPLLLGGGAALAAVGLLVSRRLCGIVGTVLMLWLALWFFPSHYIRFDDYTLTALCSLTGVLVCRRFVFRRRTASRMI